MGTFRVPESTPSPPSTPPLSEPTPMTTPPAPALRKRRPVLQAPARLQPLSLPRRKIKQETPSCSPFEHVHVSPASTGPIPLSHLRRRRQPTSRSVRQAFDHERPLQPCFDRTRRADSCFNEQPDPELIHSNIHHTFPSTPPTPPAPPAIPIIAGSRTHASAPTTGLSTFSLSLIRQNLYWSHLHRHRVVPMPGPRGAWNHTNPSSHPLPPSGLVDETLHVPNPFLHLPHPPYAPAGQHFVRNVREVFSRVDRSVHPDYLNDESDNPFVLPWFSDSAAEMDETRERVPNPFRYCLESEEEREEAEVVDCMMDAEGEEEALSFDYTATPAQDLTFGRSQSATMRAPVDGVGVVELDVPSFEGGGIVQAVWDGSTGTIKLTVGENLGAM
ncbi:hypothetical protein Vi05172_g10326 [Venturia inaequalis]|nr:hypothetical protein Vi05172_g10326 [Venturia inaequalis]